MRQRPALGRVGPQQVKLVESFRGAKKGGRARQDDFVPPLLSINCVASGLGWTG